MENNEIMFNEENEVMENPIDEEGSGIGTGMAMLIGAGLAFAVSGAIKLGKTVYAKIKAKKEPRQSNEGTYADSQDLEEIAS